MPTGCAGSETSHNSGPLFERIVKEANAVKSDSIVYSRITGSCVQFEQAATDGKECTACHRKSNSLLGLDSTIPGNNKASRPMREAVRK
jgi:hypothetical protein